MKELKFELGGRPYSIDDVELDQNEIYKILNGIFAGAQPTGRGAFIVTGCDIDNFDIASGICFIDGTSREFPGANGISFPYYIYADTESDEVVKQYKGGANEPTQFWRNATGSQTAPVSGEYITMTSSGGRTWIASQDDNVVLVTTTQSISGAKTFTNNTTMTGSLTLQGQNVNTRLNSLESDKANKSTTISAGTGLTGGGSLSTNRTISIATSGVDTTQLRDGSVTTSKLADNAVISSKIAAGAVGNSDLASNAVTSDKIADSTIVSADIASKTITATNIADDTIGAGQIGVNAVGSSELAPLSVGQGHIVDYAVTNIKLSSDSVSTSKLTANSVTNAKMADNSIGTIEIQDGSVTKAKLANPPAEIVLGGAFSSAAVIDTDVDQIGSWTVTKTSTGVYRINHSLNTKRMITLASSGDFGVIVATDKFNKFDTNFRFVTRNTEDNLEDAYIQFYSVLI